MVLSTSTTSSGRNFFSFSIDTRYVGATLRCVIKQYILRTGGGAHGEPEEAEEAGTEGEVTGSPGGGTQQKNRIRGKEGNPDWKDDWFSRRNLNNPRRNFSDSGIPYLTQALLEELIASNKGWRSFFLLPCIKYTMEGRKRQWRH